MKKVRGNRSGKPMKRKPKQREEKKKLNIKKRWDHLSSVNEKRWTSLLQNMLHFMAKKTGRFLHMKEMSLLSITIFFHILDDDRRKNAELFEEAFYEKKNLDPQMHVQQENNNATVADEVDPELLAKVLVNSEMRALLNSLAKTMK